MHLQSFKNLTLVITACLLALIATTAQGADPLPSWNEGPVKESILKFVAKVTQAGSPEFVPVEDRIATFDNDGTLWCEQPMPTQLLFALDRVKALAPQHPDWKDKEPFASILKGDTKAALAGGEHAVMDLMMATHTGNTTEEFEAIVKDWVATAKHPRYQQPYTQCTYIPMLELLAYLRANDFKNYIVSGGGIEFMRPWAQQVYAIPPQQVIGSSVKTNFEIRDGKPVLVRLPILNFIDDKGGKPVAINQHIGRRPLMAFGNSNGDQQMLEYTQGGKGPRFMLLVLHDDAVREYAYGPALGLPDTKLGAFTQSLYVKAKTQGWAVVSMKGDWKQVFAFEPCPVTAIDILLEPDAAMLKHAQATNTRLLKAYDKGFKLDADHRPHITLIQRFVRTSDLDKVCAAAEKVLVSAHANDMKLEAFKAYYIPSGSIGIAGIVARPTPELIKLQADLIAAVAPYTVDTGPIQSFVAPHDDPTMDQLLIQYVSAFVPDASGKHFNPHVTTGAAPRDYLDKMLTEPFESFTFSPAGGAVYQLGPFGSAAKLIKAWDLKTPAVR
jgi:phosphoserine phosphatase